MTNKRSNTSKWILFGCVILLVAILIVVFVWLMLDESDDIAGPSVPSATQQSLSAGETAGDVITAGATDVDPTDMTGSETSVASEQIKDPSTEATEKETKPRNEEPTAATVAQQKDAAYEEWLSAAAVVSISMNYPEFEIQGIYAPEQTALADKMDSDGIYVLFTSGGTAMAVHCYPLEAERDTAGTMDISSQNLGFNAFDLVDPAAVKTASMTSYTVEELGELIAQSMLISLYVH